MHRESLLCGWFFNEADYENKTMSQKNNIGALALTDIPSQLTISLKHRACLMAKYEECTFFHA